MVGDREYQISGLVNVIDPKSRHKQSVKLILLPESLLLQVPQKQVSTSQVEWVNMFRIPLVCAYLTQYENGAEQPWSNMFEVYAASGTSSGNIQCEDAKTLSSWIESITHNINMANQHFIFSFNKQFLPCDHIIHMCWSCQLQRHTTHWQKWRRQFVVLRGCNAFFFDTPPVKTRDWVRCTNVHKLYEVMYHPMKTTKLVDGRQHCFYVELGSEEERSCFCTETRRDLILLEKAWHKATTVAVQQKKSRTFGCTWRGRIAGLVFDIDKGILLYDRECKSFAWCYKFSQLKGSSDNGKTSLKLHFNNAQKTETREIVCTELKILLYCMHAFLSTKLAAVDQQS